jgi:hypothetical protein
MKKSRSWVNTLSPHSPSHLHLLLPREHRRMISYTARRHTLHPLSGQLLLSCLSHGLAWPHSASSSATTGPHGFQLPAATSSSAELARHLAPGRSKYSIERLFHQLPRQLHAQTGAESRPAACYPMTGPHGFGPPATPTRHLQTISPPPPGRCQRSTEKLMKWWRISRSEDWSTEIKVVLILLDLGATRTFGTDYSLEI